jgi:hypothetical protein
LLCFAEDARGGGIPGHDYSVEGFADDYVVQDATIADKWVAVSSGAIFKSGHGLLQTDNVCSK